MDPAGSPQELALRAGVDVAIWIKGEVATRERSVVSPALIPNGNVRHDAGTEQPVKELGGAVGSIGGEPMRPSRDAAKCCLASYPIVID